MADTATLFEQSTAAPFDQPIPVLAVQKWADNGALIADAASLGYLRREWRTLDPTYGYGTFWKVFRPDELVACDLNPAKSPIGSSVDFRALPFPDRSFMAVVYDGPYKLNGNPSDTDGADERYGVHTYTRWQDRMALLCDGMRECARVLGDGYLLVKCQDQVVSGKMRWQTIVLNEVAEKCGLGLVDRFDFISYRGQPSDRTRLGCPHCGGKVTKVKAGRKCREHGVVEAINVPADINTARHNASQLLVFKRGWNWRDRNEHVGPGQGTAEGDER